MILLLRPLAADTELPNPVATAEAAEAVVKGTKLSFPHFFLSLPRSFGLFGGGGSRQRKRGGAMKGTKIILQRPADFLPFLPSRVSSKFRSDTAAQTEKLENMITTGKSLDKGSFKVFKV